ncbi:E3 ubiquitin-protein ligase RFWD3-like [Pollicipes pollicipes]|uniref:E3 ubiquitin-protein ligase RFWD3-like n=1 Tax=Pollicipes pollicipes TaxID=41117 RepID=UPI001884E3F6|nr:E3 ubiquitin-protein ligase RFWD3-like [Pollicipes pollicipes]
MSLLEEDIVIDDSSDSEVGSDGGSVMDTSPPWSGSPVVGLRPAGRAASQSAPPDGTGRLRQLSPSPTAAPQLDSASAAVPGAEPSLVSATVPEPERRSSSPIAPEPNAVSGAGLEPEPSSATMQHEVRTRLPPELAPGGGRGRDSPPGSGPGWGLDPLAAGVRRSPCPEGEPEVSGLDSRVPLARDDPGPISTMDVGAGREPASPADEPGSGAVGLHPPPDVQVVAVVGGGAAGFSGRSSLGASGLWRDTDFREPARDGGSGSADAPAGPGPALRSAPASPTADDGAAAAGPQPGQKTPPKMDGGFMPALEARSPQSEDGQCCTICFEPWSNSGEHRIASLRCGHLFGRSCIERWLRGRDPRCPQCNDKAHRRDIRVIFAKSLRVLDTTDRDRALDELSREREAKRKLELDFAVVQVKCQMKENMIERLQGELRALRQKVGGGGAAAAASGGGAGASLSLHCSLEVSRGGGCRVMEYNSWMGLLVASQPSQNTLFPGHGVRKINTLDMRPQQFVSLHQKQIRDVRFSPEQRDLLLSVSLDRRAKLTNVCGNTLVQTYDCESPCWSCAWDRDAPHLFYVGLQSGAVLAFDTRAGAAPLDELAAAGHASPVVSLRHVSRGGPDGAGGLLACRLALCSLQEVRGERRRHDLPLDGPFVSAAVDERTRHLLVSSRPSSRQPHAQHTVCRLRRLPLDDAPSLVSAEVVQVFRGGTSQRVLSRSALVPHPLRPNAPLVCASQETAQVTQLWDLASGECAHTLAASEPVLDACPFTVHDRHFLALLTERQVKMYRWEVTA